MAQPVRVIKCKKQVSFIVAALSLALLAGNELAAEDVITYSPVDSDRHELTVADEDSAKSRLPMLRNFSQLPEETKEILLQGTESDVRSEAYGTGGHPFTTKRSAAAASKKKDILKEKPWSGVGKLFMRFGAGWYVCSASVIDKGLLVTAAHCVHDYGMQHEGWADEVYFEPARDGKKKPLGKWKAASYTIPTVYFNGTDTCTTHGVVCENDIAIVVLNKKGKKFVGQSCNVNHYGTNGYGYVSFSGRTASQITQLGYPVALDNGLKMIRTDSLGYQATPSNVIIGSDQTGGSSGGPWFVNFGIEYVSLSTTPTANEMRIVGVTSWGYTDSNVKIQGASRFSTNNSFVSTPNIEALHNAVCTSNPDHCFEE